MTRPKTRRAAAAATRVPSPGVRLVVADGRARLSVEDCDPRAVVDDIVASWPTREPMPAEPTSGLCGRLWWDGLDWEAPGVGHRCTLEADHGGRCRSIGPTGTEHSSHDFAPELT